MKKYLSILLIMCLICYLASGCSKNEPPQNSAAGGNTKTPKAVEVDVDLTALNSTMIYAEVYNIMTNPDAYVGKTIKMKGPYAVSYYEGADQIYHFVVIEDAAACCSQGLEFVLNGDRDFPEDYPKEQEKIEVTGVYESYDEQGLTYYRLAVDDISLLV